MNKAVEKAVRNLTTLAEDLQGYIEDLKDGVIADEDLADHFGYIDEIANEISAQTNIELD